MRALSKLPAPGLLALVYISWVILGAIGLKLPFATTTPITWSDALFTATSAVTVTGLAVVDTGATFTMLGQGILMLLIQLGGMGLMTFAVLVLSSLGMQIGLTQRNYLREEMGLSSMGGLLELAVMIFKVVLLCELLGFALMAYWRYRLCCALRYFSLWEVAKIFSSQPSHAGRNGGSNLPVLFGLWFLGME